jgi:hypothetical protein
MSLNSIGKMENNNLSNELKEINASIEKLEKKEDLIKKLYLENQNNTDSYYNKKINIIKDKQFKEISKLREQENEELNKIKEEREPFHNKKYDILRTFKLNSIKENLNEEIEIKYNGWSRKDIETLKNENLNLIKIGSFTAINQNKPINKYDLRIEVYFKNSKLENYFNIRWGNQVFEKSFKTKDEVKNYLNKNYEKIILEHKKKHDEIFAEMEKINIKLDEEFNFNIIKAYSHQWKLKTKERNKAIFINTYDENKKFEVEFLGNNKFKLSDEEEKREFELSLEYSVYNLTPEIIIE